MARKTRTTSKKKPVGARTRKAAKAKPKTARAARGGVARKAAKQPSARPERLKMRQKKHLSKSRGRSKSIASASEYEEKPGQSVATRNYEASGQWNDDWTTEPKTASRTDKEGQEG
jgi:hypothetical protein